jgi:hypothetical protein
MPKWIVEADDGVDRWRGGIVSDAGLSTINQKVDGCLLVSSGYQQWFYLMFDKFLSWPAL